VTEEPRVVGRAIRLVDRVPTRVRVTAALTAVMALLLPGAGLPPCPALE
jgi:hypothetical protein